MNGVKPQRYLKSHDRYIAVFENEQQIIHAKPNFDLIRQLDFHALVITAKGKEYDFVSRGFAPSIGIDEDYVTGSSHVALAPYWSEKLGKKQLLARQLSARPGSVSCAVEDDQVAIAGDCCLFSKGSLLIP